MSAPAPARRLGIVGAGPVGLFLGLLLARAGHACTLLEARPREAGMTDARSVALAWSVHLRLARAGVDVGALPGVSAIRTIHVSQARQPGRAVLTAADAGLPALGFVAGYGTLARALLAEAGPLCDLRFGCAVRGARSDSGSARVETAQGDLSFDAVVLAEGGSDVLEASGFQARHHDYGVHALAGWVQAEGAAPGTAYERFTADGPLALLPAGGEHALVWSLQPAVAAEVLAAPPARQLERLQDAFGWRLGRLAGLRGLASFPLSLRVVERTALGRVAVLGNAAQTLHPVAGQGLNLGLRDAWSLAGALTADEHDPGVALARHASARRPDRRFTVGFTDFLAEAFRPAHPAAVAARAAGLAALDLLPGARRVFARRLATAPLR